MRLKTRLMIFLTLLAGCTGHAVAADAVLGELAIGTSEAAVAQAYPEGTMNVNGVEVSIQGRYGDFRRGDETYEGGLTMFKLEPTVAGTQDACVSFYEDFKAAMVERHGEPVTENFTGGDDVEAKQAAWQPAGLSVSLEAVWYESQRRCDAELFVRPTDIEPLR